MKIIVLWISFFLYLDSKGQAKGSGPNGSRHSVCSFCSYFRQLCNFVLLSTCYTFVLCFLKKNGVDKEQADCAVWTVKNGCPPLRTMSGRRMWEVPSLASTTPTHVLISVDFTVLFQNTTADILLWKHFHPSKTSSYKPCRRFKLLFLCSCQPEGRFDPQRSCQQRARSNGHWGTLPKDGKHIIYCYWMYNYHN